MIDENITLGDTCYSFRILIYNEEIISHSEIPMFAPYKPL